MTTDRTALITGGSRGIGLAIARTLLEDGFQLCLVARKADQLAAAAADLDGGDRVITIAGSSDDPKHREQAVATTVATFGGLDVLVNNSGTNPHFGPIVDMDLCAAEKTFAVNVLAVMGWVQQAWHRAMQETGGVVLNIASVGGIRPGPNIGAYNVSKAALIHLTKQLAIELGPTVRVNAIAPAVIKTRFAAALYEGREPEVAARYPLGRLGVPEDVAELARFLATDRSSWMTGETVILDGGSTLTRG